MNAAEFSHVVTLAEAAQGPRVAIDADASARTRVARRLQLVGLGRLSLSAEVRAIAGGLAARGTVHAELVQSCAATDLPLALTIVETFDLKFLRDIDAPDTEEIEIGSDEIDVLPLEHDRIDLGEVAVQTLSLALDPYPRHPDADRILAEKGVLSEDMAGPFAALAALRDKGSQ